jgi:hypothetical protein
MQPVKELIDGLKLLEPFLSGNGFKFDNYENGTGSGGQFTNATYINNNKKFSIGYRYSIGFVTYQYDDSVISHGFYLDKLGYSDKKQFPDFQSDDKLLAFKHILHDFEFLIADFFEGDCKKLTAFAPLQETEENETNKRLQEEFENRFALIDINAARQLFKDKKYLECIKKYEAVNKKHLLSEFDKKSVEYCRKHLG